MIASQAVASPLGGVWKGQLGKQKITVCFNFPDSPDSFPVKGNYYYDKYKLPINLTEDKDGAPWMEHAKSMHKISGIWKLRQSVDGVIHGTWQDPKGDTELPIELVADTNNRVLKQDRGQDIPACASDFYNKPLEFLPALITGKPQVFAYTLADGSQKPTHYKYRKLRIANKEVVQLLTHEGAADRLNTEFRAMLPKSTADLADYFATRRKFLGEMGEAEEDETHTDPVFWNNDWLTVEFYDWAAGYGRQGISMVYKTWNLHTGAAIDVWKWFGTKSEDGTGDMAALPPRLGKYLSKEQPDDPSCKDKYYEGQGEFHLQLVVDGFHIYEEEFGDGCEKDYRVSLDQVWPFLSPEGKMALKSMRNNPPH